MPMDPLGTTLGAVALIAPFFNACQKLRQVHRLTQTFGEDYLVEKRYIESQYLRLDQLSKRPVRELVGYKGINVLDSNDPTMKKLISLLAEMKKHSDECDKLIKRYHGSFEPGSETNTTNLQSAQERASPYPTNPTGTINPPNIDPVDVPRKGERKRHLRFPWGKSKHLEASKAPEQPKVETLHLTPGGRGQPSILNMPAVHEEIERQRFEAANKQSSTPYLRRLSWAQSAKTDMTNLAGALGRCNNELESLFWPAPMEKSALLLRANVLTERLSDTVYLVNRALGKIHEALAKLNAPTDAYRLGDHQQICHLSVQLREDSEVNRRQLLQEPQVHLRDDSYIFNIQRQKDADPRSTADLLFVETLKDPHPEVDIIPDTGAPMPELLNLTLPPVTSGGVETLGFFRAPSSRHNIQVLFRDNSKQFSSPLHLADIVKSSEYRDHMNPTQVVQLMRLVMKSYLFFSSVRDSLDINPRLQHFRYFCRAGKEKATGWDVERPLVLRPWLSFGFGSPRRYNLGEEQGVQTISSPSLIELGLVLYQICVGEVMDYGAGSTVTKAKLDALKGLNRIDNAVGPTVTEIIQVLLSPTSLVAAGEKIEEDGETEFILNAITTLITYEEKIEDTMTAAEVRIPSPQLHSIPNMEVPTAQAVAGAVDNSRRDLG